MGAATSSPWIISRRWDLLLFIASPLLVIAVLIPVARQFPSAEFGAFLLAFFTFGHHLPGFLRAYGDRELFRSHRLQFVLAPLLIFGIALWCANRDLHALLFVAFTWDIWHVLMQQYGFVRIYDAKEGRTDKRTALHDRVLLLCWYLTFIAISPHYTHDLLLRAYSTGIAAVSPGFVSAVQSALVSVSLAVSAFYVWNVFRGSHHPPNRRKLAAIGCFLFATWFLYVWYPDFTVGFAVWSAFHCVQYYGIVWAFNRRRAEASVSPGRLLRFLFRPRTELVVLYGILIFTYGGINWAARYLSKGGGLEILMAFVVTSGTLHYYYDGFIWRVRDRGTRAPLSIDSSGRAIAWSSWRSPAVVQAAVAALVFGGMLLFEFRRPYDELNVRRRLAATMPGVAVSQLEYARALRERRAWADALNAYESTFRLGTRDAQAIHEYGLTLAGAGRHEDAIAAFKRALAQDVSLQAAHYNLAALLVRRGDARAALEHFQAAFPGSGDSGLRELETDPNAADVLTNISLGLVQAGRREEALALLRRVVTIDPRNGPAQLNLGSVLMMTGNVSEARAHYSAALATGDASIRAAAEGALARLR